MNLILNSNKMPLDSFRDSSLTHINNIKHNFIMTNPPFKTQKGIETLETNFKADNYTTIKNGIKFNDVYKLKNSNPCVQFMELNLFKLEYMGLCIIILPYGELFFGKNYKDVRQYFLSCTNITDIIIFEGGIFSHTDIKTCALIFINDPKGTKEINFLQANKECNNLSLIQTLSIDDIYKNSNCSWFIQNYINDNIYNINDSSKTYVKLGDILTLEKGKLQSSKVIEDENGEAVLINWSLYDDYKKIKDYNLDGANLFISSNMPNGNKTGYLVLKYYEGKCDYINLMSRIVIKDDYKDKIDLKFLYYFLKSKQEYIEEKCQKGSCNKSLYVEEFNEILIPLIDIELQKDNCEFIHLIINDNNKILDMQNKNYYKNIEYGYKTLFIKNKDNSVKLGDILTLEKGKLQSSKVIEDENGEAVLINWSLYDDYKKIKDYNLDGANLFISSNMPNGNKTGYLVLKYYEGKCDYINLMSRIVIKDDYKDKIDLKFLYYFLKSKQEYIEEKCQKGSCNKTLYIEEFNEILIPIYMLKQQAFIINFFDNIYNRINNNIILMQQNIDFANKIFNNIINLI